MVQKINWYQKFINIVKKIVWPLSIVVKFFKWHFNNLPLSEYFIDGWFSVISTIGLTSLFELALHKIFPNNHHVVYYGAILFAIFVLFIVLFFQHKLRENCFGESLKEFIASSKGMHPVTKKFGSYILEDFITGTFIKSEIYKEIYAKQNGIYNLSDLLKRIELKDGFQLPGELYAVLLSQSVDLEPDCLLSTWDFSIIKIEEVFNEINEFKRNMNYILML